MSSLDSSLVTTGPLDLISIRDYRTGASETESDESLVQDMFRDVMKRLQPDQGLLPDEMIGAGGYGKVFRIKGFRIRGRDIQIPDSMKVVVKEGKCRRPCLFFTRGVSVQRQLQMIQDTFQSNYCVPRLYSAWMSIPSKCADNQCLFGVAMELYGRSVMDEMRKDAAYVLDYLKDLLFQISVIQTYLTKLNLYQPDLTIKNVVMKKEPVTWNVLLNNDTMKQKSCSINIRWIDFDLAEPYQDAGSLIILPRQVKSIMPQTPSQSPFVGLPADTTIPLGFGYRTKPNKYFHHGFPDTGLVNYRGVAPFLKPLMLFTISLAYMIPANLLGHPNVLFLRRFQEDLMLVKKLEQWEESLYYWPGTVRPQDPTQTFHLDDATIRQYVDRVNRVDAGILTDTIPAGSVEESKENVFTPTPPMDRYYSSLGDEKGPVAKRTKLF